MSGIIQGTLNGLQNLVSGGTWQQSGSEIASQKFAANQAQIQRDWEERMSNTAYQRAVADMKAAGINPAMLYQSGGQGASTPSGASAGSVSATRNGQAMDLIGQTANLVNSITNARRVDEMTKQNEMKANDASRLYKTTANIAQMLAKFMA
ncbi:DNA pilot protein [Microvirus mar32]|uniref:DNA pilot protein n=1 Tax=Microvirus mar32 TaxID=2851166 RepID=A0A8F5MJM1_9VIRU|nr:DNA pilot protein [Microvirus mar32]